MKDYSEELKRFKETARIDIDFDEFLSIYSNSPSFGETFYYLRRNKMPITIIKLISKDGKTADVLCQIDPGAEGSFFFEKHMKSIQYTAGGKAGVISTSGNASRTLIFDFSIAIELLCSNSQDRYNYTIPVTSKSLVTIRNDEDASTSGGVRFIFGNLGRDILFHDNTNIMMRNSEGKLTLERELSAAERATLNSGSYPSLTGIGLKP